MTDAPAKHSFLLAAKDPGGRSTVEEVEALNADDAIRQLTQMGFTDITLESNEFEYLIPKASGDYSEITARDRLNLQSDSVVVQQLASIWIAYRPMLWLVIVATGTLAINLFRMRTFDLFDGILCVAMALPLLIMLFLPNQLAPLYRDIEVQYMKAQYDEVDRLLVIFEQRLQRVMPASYTHYVVTKWRAKSMAMRGRFAEAMALVESLETAPGIERAAYLVSRVEILGIQEDFEGIISCLKELVDLEGSTAIGLLGLSETYALIESPTEARVSINSLKSMPTSRFIRDFLPGVEGMVLVAEGEFEDALLFLENGLSLILKKKRTSPTAIRVECSIRGHLAIACVRTGDRSAAEKHFAIARPILELHKFNRLLSRCKRELGIS